jgi:uncharacterized membrane protein
MKTSIATRLSCFAAAVSMSAMILGSVVSIAERTDADGSVCLAHRALVTPTSALRVASADLATAQVAQ